MATFKLQIRSPKQALFIVAVFAAGFLFKHGCARASLSREWEELRAALKRNVEQDLKSEVFRRAASQLDPSRGLHPRQGTQLVNDLGNYDRIEIGTITRKGWGASLIVKVEFSYGPASSPSPGARYYLLQYRGLNGWTIQRPATELEYSTKFF